MKVLFASTVFPHSADPTRGVYNLSLCKAMAALPHGDDTPEVRVVCPRMWKDVLQKRGGSPIDYGKIQHVEYPTFFYPPGVGRRQLDRFLEFSGRRSVKRVTRGWKPDVVLTYWANPDGAAAASWAGRVGAKLALIVGGSDVLLLPDRPGLEGVIERTVCGSDLIRTVSSKLIDRVSELCPNSTPRTACVPQGIDTKRFIRGSIEDARRGLGLDDRPTFTWVGRLDPVKDLPLLVAATAKLKETLPDVRLLIVGGGPERGRVEEAIAEHQISDHVQLVGPVPPESLGQWYRAADAVVLSSKSEGLPNVLREALASGRPFASVDVGSVREIGDESCRVLCPPGDPSALAAAMAEVLQPRYLAGAEQTPVRSWETAAEELVADFHEVLGRPTRATSHACPAPTKAVTV